MAFWGDYGVPRDYFQNQKRKQQERQRRMVVNNTNVTNTSSSSGTISSTINVTTNVEGKEEEEEKVEGKRREFVLPVFPVELEGRSEKVLVRSHPAKDVLRLELEGVPEDVPVEIEWKGSERVEKISSKRKWDADYKEARKTFRRVRDLAVEGNADLENDKEALFQHLAAKNQKWPVSLLERFMKTHKSGKEKRGEKQKKKEKNWARAMATAGGVTVK